MVLTGSLSVWITTVPPERDSLHPSLLAFRRVAGNRVGDEVGFGFNFEVFKQCYYLAVFGFR